MIRVSHRLLFGAVLVMLPGVALSQDATISGIVRAQSGRPLAGATVQFDSAGVVVATAGTGRFVLTIPAGRAGVLTTRAIGYAPDAQTIGPLRAGGSRAISIVLSSLAQLEVQQVIAQRDRPLLNTQDATTGGAVERQEIERLPTDSRDPIALAYTIPGVAQATGFFGDAPRLSINGSNALYAQYTLDGLDNNEGFLGGPRVEFPLGALARLEVLATSYSTEFGRTDNGVVNQQSRAGTDRWQGDAFVYGRPGLSASLLGRTVRLDARPSTPQTADQRLAAEGYERLQIGGSGGGALVAGRTFVFGAVERTSENEDRISSTASTTFFGREQRSTTKLFGRLDHGWTPQQTTTLRFAMSDVNREGQGGGITAPEADITTVRRGTITALTHRSALRNGRASNTASAQLGTFRWDFPPTTSDFNTPQVTIVRAMGRDTVPVGIVGSSNFVFDESERQLQFKNVFEVAVGTRHSLRLGGDVASSSFKLTGAFTNPSGAYTVLDEGNIPVRGNRYTIADVPANVRVLSYTVDAAQKQVDLTQTLYGAFVEDRWRPSASLTVNLGLRWDYDDITSRGASSPDLNNLQPRASFNWTATPRDVVRGGAGLYAGKFPYAVYSDAVQFGPTGNQTVRFAGAQAPVYLQGPRTATIDRSTLPPGEIRELFALGLEQPVSSQFTLGYQRQLGDRAAVTVDAVVMETRNLPRSFDLNPCGRAVGPADTVNLGPLASGALPCDAQRPEGARTGSYRRHTTTESGGQASYRGLYTTGRIQATEALRLDANWVWSRSRNNTEDINFNATRGNDFGAEWADAVNDRRHKITTRAVYTPIPSLTLGLIGDYQSGQPINRVAFFRDLDGSGDTFGNGFLGNQDRFAGVPRNGERLPATFLINTSTAYALSLGMNTLELRVDLFNALNARLASGYANGIPGGGSRTQVGRPGDPVVLNAAAPPRQVQLSARFVL